MTWPIVPIVAGKVILDEVAGNERDSDAESRQHTGEQADQRGLSADPGTELARDWPGLDKKQPLKVNREEIDRIAKALNHDLQAYNSGSGATGITQKIALSQAELGTWDVAKDLASDIKDGQEAIGGVYQRLIADYTAAISLLQGSKRTYDDSETNASTAVDGRTTMI
jgi:hypothetical protein